MKTVPRLVSRLMRTIRPTVCLALLWPLLFLTPERVSASAADNDAERQAIDARFQTHARPFLETHCLSCHSPENPEGKLDLSHFTSVSSVVENFAVWEHIQRRVESAEMPPDSATSQPDSAERQEFLQWITKLRRDEANRRAGDPGPIPARRLSNSEFDNTIRDLTGVDIRPTREFPIDPANEAGFDNSGESLSMSPALLKKYLSAARHISDHLLLLPEGMTFAPHPVVTETDRDAFCVQRIVDFYRRHDVEYADYFFAAWQYRHRQQLQMPDITLPEIASAVTHRNAQLPDGLTVSADYLKRILEALEFPDAGGPLLEIQNRWKQLPPPADNEAQVRQACLDLSDRVWELRYERLPEVEKLKVRGISQGSQPLILWWNRAKASLRMRCPAGYTTTPPDASMELFCRTFPAGFSVSSRGHYSNPDLGSGIRLLSAGFHLMHGYFRDDEPLYELVLNADQKQELDRLWNDLNFATRTPIRQYKDFLFFERAEPPQFAGGAEFDFARPENQDVTTEAMLNRMQQVYLQKAVENQADDNAVGAIRSYFDEMNRKIRWIEETQRTSESIHLQELFRFSERAWRRPLTEPDRTQLYDFYRVLRTDDGLSHEEAIRDVLVSVLMSPWFCYRFQTSDDVETNPRPQADATGPRETAPLSAWQLASRLSYFLWASMPDDTLMQTARDGALLDPEVRRVQVRRMLQDDRVRGLATEWGGQWLEFRRFQDHNSVDRERFPEFTGELRESMFEEPVHFLMDLAQQNGSVPDCLYGRHTFLNPPLAQHYGIPVDWSAVPGFSDRSDPLKIWVRCDDAHSYGRGGLLPMSVFLTMNAPGLRTSPVKRGYWVARRILGEHIPAPPPNVPELPKDEAQLGEATLASLLAQHRSHVACAGCHQRFDALGLVFEGYGPTGERRDTDLGGRPVENSAEFPDGTSGLGLSGLRDYLHAAREEDFLDNFCRKLAAWGLGRTLLLSDDLLIEEMKRKLREHDGRFHSAVETIVDSPQFLNRRTAAAAPSDEVPTRSEFP